jgi:hypothetical protein
MNPEMAILFRKMDQMMVAMVASPHMTTKHDPCSFCFSPMHRDSNRLSPRKFFDIPNEHVNAAFSRPSNDPYSNSYNLGCRNHPNFSWRAQDSGNSPPRLYNQAHSTKLPSLAYRPP